MENVKKVIEIRVPLNSMSECGETCMVWMKTESEVKAMLAMDLGC